MAKRAMAWLFVAVWMMVIYGFSSENIVISRSLSTKATVGLEKIVAGANDKNEPIDTTSETFLTKELIVRKCAHVIEYLILGTLCLLASIRSLTGRYKAYVLAFAISLLYALLDEFHQLFIFGREGKLLDVTIDCIGIFLALSVFHMISNYKCKKLKV